MRGDLPEIIETADILVEELEGLLRELNEFTASKPDSIPQSLERYLQFVAKSGNIVFPWQHVRLLFRNKMLQAMEQFPGEMSPHTEAFVMERFDLFRSAPFTIQRLAELITYPTRHYKKKEKFLRGVEKTVLVVSTVEPWSLDAEVKNGNDDSESEDMDQNYSENDELPYPLVRCEIPNHPPHEIHPQDLILNPIQTNCIMPLEEEHNLAVNSLNVDGAGQMIAIDEKLIPKEEPATYGEICYPLGPVDDFHEQKITTTPAQSSCIPLEQETSVAVDNLNIVIEGDQLNALKEEKVMHDEEAMPETYSDNYPLSIEPDPIPEINQQDLILNAVDESGLHQAPLPSEEETNEAVNNINIVINAGLLNAEEKVTEEEPPNIKQEQEKNIIPSEQDLPDNNGPTDNSENLDQTQIEQPNPVND